MKKLCFLFALVVVFSCDDGDLPLEEIDFASTSNVAVCDLEPGPTLLFKIDDAVALILEVPNTLIVNSPTEDETPRTLSLTNGNTTAYYRGFNTVITSSYFCDQLPPAGIEVTLEYTANNGLIKVTTTEITDPNDATVVTDYRHEIIIENIVFTDEEGNSLTEEMLEFGTIIIPAE